ncbi:hypothetical protein [Vibrio mediterranei]|uniref:hypothetical protein n=1 Tax=Vibrio mediterranei TaxID=689 RepID=UPI0040691764
MAQAQTINQLDLFNIESVLFTPSFKPRAIEYTDLPNDPETIKHYCKRAFSDAETFYLISTEPLPPIKDWDMARIIVGNAHFYAYFERRKSMRFEDHNIVKFEVVSIGERYVLTGAKEGNPLAYITTLDGEMFEHALANPGAPIESHGFSVLGSKYEIEDWRDYLEPSCDDGLYSSCIELCENGNRRHVALQLKPEVMKKVMDARICSDYHISIYMYVRTSLLGEKHLDLSFRYSEIIGGRTIATIKWIDELDSFVRTDLHISHSGKAAARAFEAKRKQNDSTSLCEELGLLVIESDTRVNLPKQRLTHYDAIKRKLEEADATYDNNGFNFKYGNAADVIEDLKAGKKVRARYKDFAFFSSGPQASDMIIEHAYVEQNSTVFEPHAGHGDLCDAVLAAEPTVKLTTNELWDENVEILQKKGYEPLNHNFLDLNPDDVGLFDRVIGNPPWGNLVEIDHLKHALDFVKPNGRLTMAIASSYQTGDTKAKVAFREWLKSHGAHEIDIPAGSFNRTAVGGTLIVIDKA